MKEHRAKNQTGNRAGGVFRAVAGRGIVLSCLLLPCGGVIAQSSQTAATSQPRAQAALPVPVPHKETIPALLLSDIHFEPFWDPGKVPQLAAAPVSEWKTILAAPSSADREQRFASLETTCHTRGEDTPYALLESSLQAARIHAAGAKFITVSGDLMAHAFSCKYDALFPHASPGDYRNFTEKTLAYVMRELDGLSPGILVYAALGNNDSDCGDYQLDAHSEFLAAVSEEFTKGFPASERQSALESFAAGGYYSISLPAPVGNARLLVLNDLFMSSKYSTCAGKDDTTAADAQLAWLERQLTEARSNKQKVWVMGHIPPGVDVHATVTKMRDVCGGQKPVMFLSSEKLADELVDFSDVVELGIFAHTHMDEVRILKAVDGGEGTKQGKSVAVSGVVVKMVPSISPIDGNAPSFTVARIDPALAMLVDYRVFTASNQTGVDTVWQEEYDYEQTYHEADFSAFMVSQLIARFRADPSAKTEASSAYIRNFIAGKDSPLLGVVWPQYVCSLSNHSSEGFRSCVCNGAR
jgi:sphingomyelin phosphodiesterase acid-like 3